MRIARLFVSCLPLLAFALGITFQASFAAEPANPGSDEALLRDLKVTAKAEWKPETEYIVGQQSPKPKPPTLKLIIDFQGTATQHANAFGELRLDAMLDQNGKSYRRDCKGWGPCAAGDMEAKPRKKFMPLRGSEDSLVVLEIPNRPPIQQFREIRGSIALQTGGQQESITIKDVFKHLGEPAEMSAMTAVVYNGKIQWMAEPIEAAASADSVIKVATKRFSVQSDPIAKDLVGIQVECRDPAIDFEILDSTGKPLKGLFENMTGSLPCWLCWFASNQRIPADAQLRLTLDKNSRKIRVPFALTNITVPRIDEKNTRLNVASRPEEPMHRQNLGIQVELLGKLAASATSYGEAEIDTIVNERGQPLFVPTIHQLMSARFPTEQDRTIVYFTLPQPEPLRKINELRGSVALQLPGKPEELVVKDFLKRLSGPENTIDDEQLRVLGIVANVKSENGIHWEVGSVETLRIALKWKKTSVVRCEVIDREGKPLPEVHNGGWFGNHNQINWSQMYKGTVPRDAQLRLTVHKDSRKVRVPFVLKNIDVPPRPEDDDEKPFTGVVPGGKNKQAAAQHSQ